jgi:hypothetical protein
MNKQTRYPEEFKIEAVKQITKLILPETIYLALFQGLNLTT